MKTRCRPGDRCVIVAEVPACACNVGATVIVTFMGLSLTASGPAPIWKFKDASRPVKVVDLDARGQVIPGTPVQWVTSSDGYPLDRCPGIFDHHLVPLHADGEQLLQAERDEVPA